MMNTKDELRVGLITGSPTNRKNPELLMAAGFSQYLNVFQNSILYLNTIPAHLKDNDFHLFIIRLSFQTLDLLKSVREKIGHPAATRLIGLIDIPEAIWVKEFRDMKKLKQILMLTDFLLAADYPTASAMEKYLNRPVYRIPNPADLEKIKTYKKSISKKSITIISDENKPYLNIPASFYRYTSLRIRHISINHRTVRYRYLNYQMKSPLLEYQSDDEIIGHLLDSEIIINASRNSDDGRILLYAAAIGCLVFGNGYHDLLNRCYPELSVPFRNIWQYWSYYQSLQKKPQFIESILENALYKVENYNWGNIRKRLLHLLYHKTGDPVFVYRPYCPVNKKTGPVFWEKIPYLYGKKKLSCQKDEFIVVCLVKNGIDYLNSFLQHHRQIGASHFVFIDNGSNDGTIEVIKNQKDVTLYQTGLIHKHFENEIRRTIIEEHCTGCWCLCLDIDEFFDYPASDQISMHQFLTYLNQYGYTALLANMLDMFCPELDFSSMSKGLDPTQIFTYYDISGVKKGRYQSYARPFICYNTLSDRKMKYYTHGIRSHMFTTAGHPYLLIKHPLTFIDSKIEIAVNPHYCNNAYIADVNGLIKHYKLSFSFKDKVMASAGNLDYYAAMEYENYTNILNDHQKITFPLKKARRFTSINELVKLNFLRVSGKYRYFVHHISGKNTISNPLL